MFDGKVRNSPVIAYRWMMQSCILWSRCKLLTQASLAPSVRTAQQSSQGESPRIKCWAEILVGAPFGRTMYPSRSQDSLSNTNGRRRGWRWVAAQVVSAAAEGVAVAAAGLGGGE